jgi:hypothetical protein
MQTKIIIGRKAWEAECSWGNFDDNGGDGIRRSASPQIGKSDTGGEKLSLILIVICGVCWGVYQLATHVALYISSLFS